MIERATTTVFLLISIGSLGFAQQLEKPDKDSAAIVRLRESEEHIPPRGLPTKFQLARYYASYVGFAKRHRFAEPLQEDERTLSDCPKGTVHVDRLDMKAPDIEGEMCRVVSGRPMIQSDMLKWLAQDDPDSPASKDDSDSNTPFDSNATFDDDVFPPFTTLDPARAFHFLPVYVVSEGYELIDNALQVAHSRRLFDCDTFSVEEMRIENAHIPIAPGQRFSDPEDVCIFLTVSTAKGRRVISACQVSGDVVHDPPFECIPFIILDGRDAWISALDAIFVPYSGGEEAGIEPPSPGLELTLLFRGSQFPYEAIVTRALRSEPLDLLIEHSDQSYIKASRPKQISKVLSPWHEWVKVTAEVSPPSPYRDYPGYTAIQLQIDVLLFVNKAIGGDEGAWSAPKQSMVAAYSQALQRNILTEVRANCPNGVLDKGDVLVCLAGK